jgi:hypothetical protein
MTTSFKDLEPGKRVGYGILGVLQAAFAFLAFWDLAHRPADQIRGPKPVWIPVILISWIGPLTYFFVHRRH